MELVLQALIEAGATEVIGAGLYERSDTRTTNYSLILLPGLGACW